MGRFQIIILCLLSGVLLGMAWPGTGDFPPALFVALVPLLMLEDYFYQERERFKLRATYKYFLLTFVTWNGIGTWWLYTVSEPMTTKIVSAAGTAVANGLLQALPFYAFHFVRRKMNDWRGYLAFVIFWVGFEYFHFDWELAWPWLNLGNAFANFPSWIQWYSLTGILGGSLWVILINLTIFRLLKKSGYSVKNFAKQRNLLTTLAILVFVPLTISLITYYTHEDKGEETEVLLIQPNVDPYTEKFYRPPVEQIQDMVEQAKPKLTNKTAFLVLPETAIQEGSTVQLSDGRMLSTSGIIETEMERTGSYQVLSTLHREYPNLNILTGLTTQKIFGKDEQLSSTARTNQYVDFHYDVYNAAAMWSGKDSLQFYNKSKLVIGVERLPFAGVLKPLENLAMDLGGASGSLGTQEEAEVFKSSSTDVIAAPLICFESVFGEYVGDFVEKGANVLFVITNDGWWSDSPGYKQHLAFSRLRAIETRRSVARSANTGTTCFINQRGDIINPTEFWVKDALSGTVKSNTELTIYARFGDYIGRLTLFIAVLLLLYGIVIHFRSKGETLP